MKFFLQSMGCLKNSADSAQLAERLRRKGFPQASSADGAGILIVNTCGFIEDAKRESIDEILRLAEGKNGRKLLVMGCLSKRYGKELLEGMPEIDALYGVGEAEMSRLIDEMGDKGERGVDDPLMPLSVPLKIAEGCSRRCGFCVIPSIRGPFRGRRPEDVLAEAEGRIKAGARELVLVAQDLTGYGKGTGYGLHSLLRDMASISGDFWIRPLYLHPAGIDEPLLRAIAEEEKICKYIDMPLQHSEERILRLMGRAGGGKSHLRLIRRIREAIAGVALRTTLMTGFPGEREADFRGLLGFMEEAEFERLGAFKFSKEEGTKAYSMKGQVPEKTKQRRLDEIMGLQMEISLRKNLSLVGSRFRALAEDDKTARIYSQAREVDGVTLIKGGRVKKGGFVDVLITGAEHYDLHGVPA